MRFLFRYFVTAPFPMLMYASYTTCHTKDIHGALRFSLGTSLYRAILWQPLAVQIGYPADLSKAPRLVSKEKSHYSQALSLYWRLFK